MAIELPPPPREKQDARQNEQWLETAWRTVTELRTDLDDTIADLAAAITAASGYMKLTTDQTATGIKTFSGQLIGMGTATNDAAGAGYIGQVISSTSASTSFPTSTQWGDVTSIALTAGNWIVAGSLLASRNAATVSVFSVGISTTSGNFSTGLTSGSTRMDQIGPAAAYDSSANITPFRVSLSGGATYILKMNATYSVATPICVGTIFAWRPR